MRGGDGLTGKIESCERLPKLCHGSSEPVCEDITSYDSRA